MIQVAGEATEASHATFVAHFSLSDAPQSLPDVRSDVPQDPEVEAHLPTPFGFKKYPFLHDSQFSALSKIHESPEATIPLLHVQTFKLFFLQT